MRALAWRTVPETRRTRRGTRLGLMALLAGAGVLHFAVPGYYRRIVPHALGHEGLVVAASGLAEFACAGALAWPRTRRLGGWLTAGLFVAVFPANVQMAVDAGFPSAPWLRLPLQVPLVVWAVAVARAETADPE